MENPCIGCIVETVCNKMCEEALPYYKSLVKKRDVNTYEGLEEVYIEAFENDVNQKSIVKNVKTLGEKLSLFIVRIIELI